MLSRDSNRTDRKQKASKIKLQCCLLLLIVCKYWKYSYISHILCFFLRDTMIYSVAECQEDFKPIMFVYQTERMNCRKL